jgi:hypothetical protein
MPASTKSPQKAGKRKAGSALQQDDDDEYETVYVVLEVPAVDSLALTGGTSCKIAVRAMNSSAAHTY